MTQDWETNQTRMTWAIGGAALGALAMFLMDPDRGNQRRALATDKMRSIGTRANDALDVASRDLGNRAQGLRARANRMLRRNEKDTDDRVLAERVRQKLGRAVSHPRAIDVTTYQGRIVLSGHVLAHEKQALLDTVRGVQGVSEVNDQLQEHEHAENISSLQGSGKSGTSMEREIWSPALRAVATIGGSVLGAYGLTRRTPASTMMAIGGILLAVRGMSGMPLTRMTGIRGDSQAITQNKTIHIDAPPDKVFDLWSKFENFPQFMSHIREVRALGNGRSHWIASGPAGIPVEWDAVTTESRRPEVLAWESEPGSTVQTSGKIRFDPDGNGTRVSVHMAYSPPAGVLGHAVASLFRRNPKRQMDEDLMRMKAFIETGHAPHDAAQSVRQPGAVQH